MDLLDKIKSPRDLKKLDMRQLDLLAKEIREFLIKSVSKTGGHLASNLGTIELTLALHRVFDTENDRIVWDVGHQSYTIKLPDARKNLILSGASEVLAVFPGLKKVFMMPLTPVTAVLPFPLRWALRRQGTCGVKNIP